MTVKTMKAVQQHTFGGPQVLNYEDSPLPALKPGELLVRVKAASLNPPDWYLREGYKSLPPEWRPEVDFPLILGSDVSGVVEAVADDVSDFRAGDEVYSMVRFPEGMAGGSRAHAQYVTVPATQAAIKPAGIDHDHAAAAPMSLLTAWQFLVDLGHEESNPFQEQPHKPVALAGKTVLVNGAAGGVGHFMLQVAKFKGAKVIAVASGRHENLLRELGADELIDYTQTAVEEQVRDVDLVVDCVGGANTGRFLNTLKPGGALFIVNPLGFTGWEEAEQAGFIVSSTQVRSNGAQLAELATLLDEGHIRAAIDSVYPMECAGAAYERAEEGHISGKIVLTV